MKLYHSTATENVFSIIEDGLKIEKSRDGAIFFGEDDYTAACFQFLHNINEFSIIEFTVPKAKYEIRLSDDHNEELLKKLFPELKKCYYTMTDIPPEYITSICDFQNGQKIYWDKEDWL